MSVSSLATLPTSRVDLPSHPNRSYSSLFDPAGPYRVLYRYDGTLLNVFVQQQPVSLPDIRFSSKHSRFVGQVTWSSSYNAVIITRLVLRLLSPTCHPIPIIRQILSFHGLTHVLGFR